MPIEFHRDGPWNLPEGWVWARLGDVAHVNPPTPFDELPAELEIPFLPMAAMAEENGVMDLSQRRPVAQLMKGYTRFQTGDVLFAKITPCMENGKSAPITDLPSGYRAGSTEFHVIRSGVLNPRYLWYWIVRQAFRGDAQRNMSGSAGQMRVPADYLRDAQIAIPPTAEQRRIVARIDELFIEINDGEATLTRARGDLDTWRRALLKAAVTGELTREWRKHNKLTREKGAFDQLLKRRNLREKDADPRNHAEVGANRRSLSDGWIKGVLEQVGRIESGQTPTGIATMTNQGGTIPWFKVSSMNDANANGWMTNSEWWISEKAANEMKLRIHPVGTIVFPKRGGSILTNKKRRLAVRGCIGLNTMGFVPLEAYREYSWVVFQQIDLRRIYDGSNVPQINYGDVAEITLAIPPPKEGEEIARRAMDALSVVDDVAAELQAGSAAAVALRRSTLKAAFEGRLVEQDPSDEPAECLLARINIPASGSRARLARGTVGANA
jgi:type I restriction enzyme S subunit